ncbi:MAG: lipopolysaccharide export system permease protein lptG [Thermoanaerobaculia bacterium]|jgi:LPS export ABC transporter permease LptG|nr:lipopolysaccharide export system permease protein lptG [Thermoanaerobaculia bacterium]
MKILTRYILKEMLGPTVLGFAFYTFIILMKNLFDFAGMIIKRSLPASTVARLLYLSLPHIVVLTVPMSLLFGILIAIGRLSSDSEIIAMRALGISTRTIYRPVFIFSTLVFFLNLYLMNFVLPQGNAEFAALRSEIFTSQIEKELKPRVFYDEYENLTIYVNDVDAKTLQWKGVFVADSRTGDEARTGTTNAPTIAQQVQSARKEAQATSILPQRSSNKIVVADSGNLSILKPGNQVWLNLKSAETHLWDPKKPDRYDLNSNKVQRMRLPDKFSDTNGGYQRSLREMNFRELMEQARWSQYSRDPDARETYWAAKVEMHKMFAIPFACIVFGILGLPLGITNRRGGKSSGFSLSILIILIYYVMIINGEHLADTGKIGPALAMWTPNALFLGLGVYLLIRANRDTGAQRSEGGFIRRIVAAIKSKKRGSTASASASEDSGILSRFDITFPNTLDRYIIREFLKILGMVVISTAALFVIVDYTGLSGDIRSNHIPLSVVLAYYRFVIFGILNYTLPISVLVATLVTFGIFSKNNEVTAFKSGGMSLYRAALPIVGIAIAISMLAYLQLDYILPYSNQRSQELADRIKAKKTAHLTAAAHQQRLWFLGKGRYLINFLAYDREEKELSQVQVFEFDPTKFHLTRRVYAEHARWDGVGWVFSNGWMRSFPDNGPSTLALINRPLRLFYSERPEDFATEARAPDQMTFGQLRTYIDTIRRSGYAAEELSVKLYTKTSWPFISLVMALIALPFAFRIGKRGALYGVGVGLILGIIYWMVFAVFTKFGEVGNLPAFLSAWSANVLFSIAAVYMFLNVET